MSAQKSMQGETAQKQQSQSVWSQTQQPQTQQPKPTPPAAKSLHVNDFIEPDELGQQVVNVDKLSKALEEINSTQQQVVQSGKQAQEFIETQQKKEEIRQTQEAYAQYPQLNPDGKEYNTEFLRLTRQILVDSYAYPDDYGGISLTVKQAADRAAVYSTALSSGQTHEQAQAAADKEAIKQEAENKAKVEEAQKNAELTKQNASLEVRGSGQAGVQALTDADHVNLVMKTRLGDNWALAQRLQTVSHAGTPSSSRT